MNYLLKDIPKNMNLKDKQEKNVEYRWLYKEHLVIWKDVLNGEIGEMYRYN